MACCIRGVDSFEETVPVGLKKVGADPSSSADAATAARADDADSGSPPLPARPAPSPPPLPRRSRDSARPPRRCDIVQNPGGGRQERFEKGEREAIWGEKA